MYVLLYNGLIQFEVQDITQFGVEMQEKSKKDY